MLSRRSTQLGGSDGCLATQGCQESAPKRLQTSSHIGPEMRAQRAAIALQQNLEISLGLGRLDHAKGVLPSRHGQIDRVIAGDLQEDPRVRPPL
jgi:hypothetical protein